MEVSALVEEEMQKAFKYVEEVIFMYCIYGSLFTGNSLKKFQYANIFETIFADCMTQN